MILAATCRRETSQGYYSPDRRARSTEKSLHEIAILSEAISEGIAQAWNAVLHELLDYINHAYYSRDCCRGGRNHNQNCKFMAETVGSVAIQVDNDGYARMILVPDE